MRDSLTAMHHRHAEMLPNATLSAEDLEGANAALRRLERFWIRAGDFVQRPPQFADYPMPPADKPLVAMLRDLL